MADDINWKCSDRTRVSRRQNDEFIEQNTGGGVTVSWEGGEERQQREERHLFKGGGADAICKYTHYPMHLGGGGEITFPSSLPGGSLTPEEGWGQGRKAT